MNDINDVYLFANFLANKTYSGSISPDEFNLCAPIAQEEYMRKNLGLPEQFQYNIREARNQFQAAQINADLLRTFVVEAPVNGTGGFFPLPADYCAYGNLEYTYTYQDANQQTQFSVQPIEAVTLSERALRLDNYVRKPTLRYPIWTYLNNQMRVDPVTITAARLQYVRYPLTPVRGYTLNLNDQDVYDSATSVQLEFPKLEWKNIAVIIVDYWATFLRDTELKQATTKMMETGQ